MAETAQSSTPPAPAAPAPRKWAVEPVAIGDILEIMAAGLRDFRAAPWCGLIVGAFYMVSGWILVLLLLQFHLPFLVYPLVAGFALIAPFTAASFYAASSMIERKEPLSPARVIGAVRHAAKRDLGWMALVTVFALFIWMDIAALLFFGFLGLNPGSVQDILREIFTTPAGLLFLLIGNGAGAFLALFVFSISVTSFPMLFDRDVDFVTAMVTSVQVVTKNPRAMIAWCVTIACLVGISLLSGLVALPVILPVLGHASWHLYRRAVQPAA